MFANNTKHIPGLLYSNHIHIRYFIIEKCRWLYQNMRQWSHWKLTETWRYDISSTDAMLRADSRLAPSQWETSLQNNTVSHWLGASLESALNARVNCISHLRANWMPPSLSPEGKLNDSLPPRAIWMSLSSECLSCLRAIWMFLSIESNLNAQKIILCNELKVYTLKMIASSHRDQLMR